MSIFVNDDNVKINLPSHHFSEQFKTRINAEAIFRKMCTYLIKNSIIKDNIIDLGSWMGDNAIPWAKNINGIVYAIDPSNENCLFTNEVAKLNDISNIKTVQCAISNKNELLTTNDDINHCSFVLPDLGLGGNTKVNAYTLDYLYEQKDVDNIGFIHLDVEGMEYRVIEGASNIINIFRPIVAFEQHLESDNYKALSSHFKNLNYNVYLINETFNGCKPDCRNLIAFPNEKTDSDLIKRLSEYVNIENVFTEM